MLTSGLALGIDGACHEGALSVGGETLAVLGSGLDHIYPKNHSRLAEQIVAQRGALISEFPPYTPPKAENFPRRNRIISGLSQAVLVIEAALKSGSLITARLAADQGRDVFALPGPIDKPHSKGCHMLIREGAGLTENVEELIDYWRDHPRNTSLPQRLAAMPINRPTPLPASAPQAAEKHFAGDEAIIWRCFEQEPEHLHVDDLISASQLTIEKVSSILLNFELSGHIENVFGGYRRCR